MMLNWKSSVVVVCLVDVLGQLGFCQALPPLQNVDVIEELVVIVQPSFKA